VPASAGGAGKHVDVDAVACAWSSVDSAGVSGRNESGGLAEAMGDTQANSLGGGRRGGVENKNTLTSQVQCAVHCTFLESLHLNKHTRQRC